MTTTFQQHHPGLRAAELGLSEDILACALNMIEQNRNLVNAMDNSVEMDDYIYRAVIKQATEKRKQKAEAALYSADKSTRANAEKDLKVMSREELTTDPFYRAVLPLMVKVLRNEPILRLHAEEASAIVLQLAEFKRRHRATSVTEVIVKHFTTQMDDAGFK